MNKEKFLKKLVGKVIKYRPESFWGRIDYWLLRKKLLKARKLTKKQYHVVPLDNGEITVMDNVFRKRFNKTVPKHQRINGKEMLEIALFSTPTGTRLIT